MNVRFAIVAAVLGTAIMAAFLMGSPMFGGYDMAAR